ncbi:MAG TPA: PTS sugar transporter subunit IIA, partial [Trichococcus flocculiformis]|nr:PTS sugar transporter subunit IIA [Trichococcus flocculiformis]
MVGIILASHGNFAEGILQSASMIFGEQENVKAVTLAPSEGPDDVKAKMQEAISSFDNQANSLFEAHKDTWAIIAGMNLPMVIEAYAARLSMDSAQKIAAQILPAAKDGVRAKPESLEPKKVEAASAVQQPKGNLPVGTVVGDGKI